MVFTVLIHPYCWIELNCQVYGVWWFRRLSGYVFSKFLLSCTKCFEMKTNKQTKTQKTHKLKTVFRCYGNKTWVLSLELLNSYLIVYPGSEWWMRRTSRGNGFVLVVVNTLLLIIIQTLSTMFIASLVFLICCPGFVFLLCWQWKCHLHCLPPDTALLFLKNHLCTGGRRLLEIVMAFWQSQSSFQVKSYLKKIYHCRSRFFQMLAVSGYPASLWLQDPGFNCPVGSLDKTEGRKSGFDLPFNKGDLNDRCTNAPIFLIFFLGSILVSLLWTHYFFPLTFKSLTFSQGDNLVYFLQLKEYEKVVFVWSLVWLPCRRWWNRLLFKS